MYNVLLVAKEIYTGCEELVNKEVMSGVMNNPEFTNESCNDDIFNIRKGNNVYFRQNTKGR
jgi:hypothetical protein